MNNIKLQEILIDNFKKEMKEKLGKGVKITICNKWQSEANFTDKVNLWAVIRLVFDYTGWCWKSTYKLSPYKGSILPGANAKVVSRSDEKVFRRSLIDYILINNGVTLVTCARETNRTNHSTIIHSVNRFEERLETDYMTQKFFAETMAYIKDNYHLYKDKTTLKIGVVEEQL